MTKTKNQLTAKVKETSSLLSAAVLGLGVGLIVSIIFTKIGVWLVLVGLLVKNFGSGISQIIPGFFKYQPVTCPFCRETSQVRLNVDEFSCDNCGRLLATVRGKVKLSTHLKLVVDNSSTIYGKPVIDDPMKSGHKLKGNS